VLPAIGRLKEGAEKGTNMARVAVSRAAKWAGWKVRFATAVAAAEVMCMLTAQGALAGRIRIGFVSDLAYDQPRVAVYLRDALGILPHGTEGWAVPGLVDTGAAAHVLPAYLAAPDALDVPIDPEGEAEVLTMCGTYEYLQVSEPLWVGVGPYDSEDEADYLETGPHRLAVRVVDPPGSEDLLFPMIVGTPFLKDWAARVEWEMVEIWDGIEVPALVTEFWQAGTPSGAPVDLTVPLTLRGEVNLDPNLPLPTAYGVPFARVQIRNGERCLTRTFIVDTGAQISFMSSQLAEELGIDLSRPAGSGLPIVGAGSCSKTIYPYLVEEFNLPTEQGVTLSFQQPMIYVLDVPGIDGGIGSNMLFFFDELQAVEIDLASGRLSMLLNVPIPPAGDVTGDGAVDLADLLALVNVFGADESDGRYDPAADIDGNGSVDLLDLLWLVNDFGDGLP